MLLLVLGSVKNILVLALLYICTHSYWIINSGVELLINKVCVFSASVDSATVKNGCTKLYSHEQGRISHGSRLVSALGIVSLLNFNPFL